MIVYVFQAVALGLGIAMVIFPLALRLERSCARVKRLTDWHHAHGGAVPRVGGAVLVCAFLILEMWIAVFHSDLRDRTPGRNVMLLASLAIFGVGFWDDVRPLRAATKLLLQILIAVLVCFGGIGIEMCHIPFNHAEIHLGLWGPILTILWLVTLPNLINLIDGIDGLAGGICVMLMCLVAAVAHQDGNFELLACGMAGALLGFLRYNFPPARVYLGDGGAYFLGFQIGLYSIVNSHKGTVFAALVGPLFVLALPITDAVLTVARRGLRGLPLFRPDRKHLHHRLASIGYSRRRVLLIVYAINLLFLVMGLISFWSNGQWVPMLAGAAILLLFICAGTCPFSRRWFAVHRVVSGSLRMREHVRYALSLVRWLDLEARRRSSPEELWPDLVFAVNKLGFSSLKITLNQQQKSWQRAGPAVGDVLLYQCPNSTFGMLEFEGPPCVRGRTNRFYHCDCRAACRGPRPGCLADPRVFETISELLAEAWNNAAAQWHARRVPLKFGTSGVPGHGSQASNELVSSRLPDATS